jgi:hypothetical protein
MPEMMHAADVIITKAGPGSICEALACNLPIILSGFVPGQESGNVTFVTENGAGVLARTPGEVINALRQLIKPGSQVLKQQLEHAHALSHPRTSFEIVQHILSYIPQESIWQEEDPPTATGLRRRRLLTADIPASGHKFPQQVASIIVGPRPRGKVASLTLLSRSTRPTGPLDVRTTSRRLPQLIGRTRVHDDSQHQD